MIPHESQSLLTSNPSREGGYYPGGRDSKLCFEYLKTFSGTENNLPHHAAGKTLPKSAFFLTIPGYLLAPQAHIPLKSKYYDNSRKKSESGRPQAEGRSLQK